MAPSARLVLLALALVAMGAQGRKLRACTSPCVSQKSGGIWSSTLITNPANACDAPENSCCDACVKVWQPYVLPNYLTSPKTEFVYSGHQGALTPPDAATNDHFLVVPNKPCRGVEDWHEPQKCHYEYVWDAAWATLTTGTLKGAKAMAINSQHHRTQHQMHVHVADIQTGLGAWLRTVPADNKQYSSDCNANHVVDALKCGATQPGPGGNVQAVCKKVASPSAAAPFETAYTKSYTTAMSKRGTLVYSPAAGVFCVVTFERPAECMLHCATECAGKLKQYCP